MSYLLAIDYGTSFTSAAVASPGQRPQTIEIQGLARFPSHVFFDETSHRFLVGKAAENSAAAAPERFRRAPKRDLGSSEPLLFGGDARPVEEAVAAVLREVLEEAKRRHRGEMPSEVRLTHPASWRGDKRMKALGDAAAKVGIHSPTFLPEPVAAALHLADETVTPGMYVAVYDLGGGTFDTAVVQRTEEGGFKVVGQPGGQDDLGGEDFDLWLYKHLREQLAALDPEGVETFEKSTDPTHYRARRAFLEDVREAKETLSSYESVNELWVGEPLKRNLVVYRHEFEHLIEGAVQRSVAELEKTIIAAGIQRDQLAGVYLTGGSSRIPLVARRVQARFGRADTRDDPKTVVALGAAGELETRTAPAPGPTPTPGPTPADTLTCKTAPVISGAPKVGRWLTSTPGRWEPAPDDVAIKWLRGPESGDIPADRAGWDPIPGATERRYQLTEADEGRRLMVEAEAESGGQRASAHSKPSAVVVPTRVGTGTGGTGATDAAKKSRWPKVAAGLAAVLVAGLIVAAATGAFSGSPEPDPDPEPPPVADADFDDVPDSSDNCESTSNPGQVDSDADGTGDACDETEPEPDPETGSEEELYSWIPTPIDETCETIDLSAEGEPADAVAGYSCSPSRADGLNYYMFSDDVATREFYDSTFSNLGDGDCATTWEVEGTWHYNSDPDTPVGPLKCYYTEDGDAFIEWAHEGIYIDAYAWTSDTSDQGLDRLYNLFSDAVPLEPEY